MWILEKHFIYNLANRAKILSTGIKVILAGICGVGGAVVVTQYHSERGVRSKRSES